MVMKALWRKSGGVWTETGPAEGRTLAMDYCILTIAVSVRIAFLLYCFELSLQVSLDCVLVTY